MPLALQVSGLVLAQTAPSLLVLNFDGFVRLGIGAGHIHYQRLGAVSDDEVRHMVSDWGLALLLLLRGTPPMHASAVRSGADGGASLFCGLSGAGKSTLSLALARRGYPKIADDIAAIRFEPGAVYVEPGVAHSKLMVDALDRLQLPQDGLRPVTHKAYKFIVPLDVWRQPEPLRQIIELQLQPTGPVVLQELRGAEKLGVLDRHTVGTTVMRRFGFRGMHLQWLQRIASSTPVYRLTRPADRDSMDEIIDTLERLWHPDSAGA